MKPCHRFFRLLIAALALAGPAAKAATDCPTAADIDSAHFVGEWAITLAATPGQRPERGLLQLQSHPVYSDSLKGALQRGAQRLQIVADWEDGQLTFEESADGERISATWQARLVAGQCGRVFEGVRFTGDAPDAWAQRFRMRAERAR